MGNSERDGNTRPPDLPLENLYADQEATVTTGHGTTDWFQIGKGVQSPVISSGLGLSKTACKAFERGISVSFSTLGHLDVRTLVFLSQMSWGLISSVLLSRDRGLNPVLLQEQCFSGKISSYCVLTHWAGGEKGS